MFSESLTENWPGGKIGFIYVPNLHEKVDFEGDDGTVPRTCFSETDVLKTVHQRQLMKNIS